MDNLKRLGAAFTDVDDLVIWQSRITTVDMAHHIRASFQHHCRIDQSRFGNRRPAGVDRALHAVFTRPIHHFARCLTILDRTQHDRSQQLDADLG